MGSVVPNWAAGFSACHPARLELLAGLELLGAFKISHWNFWFLWLQWLESYRKLLPSLTPFLFLSLNLLSLISRSQLIAEPVLSWSLGGCVLTAALPGASFLFVYLYTEISFQYIYPDKISPENTLRNSKNVFSQFLKDTPTGWVYLYFSSLDFLKRMHTMIQNWSYFVPELNHIAFLKSQWFVQRLFNNYCKKN